MNSYFYNYHLLKQNDKKCLLQFGFDTIDLKSRNKVSYIAEFRSFDKNNNLYYCDFFPAFWEDHSDRLNKLLSNETGIVVNFRKITITCFYIFHEYIAARNSESVFVVSGSLIVGEKNLPEINISRKLNLYWNILKPYAKKLGYRIVKMLDYNAIAFVKNQNKITDNNIQNEYSCFKKR